MSVTTPRLEVDAFLAEMARLEELRLTLALGVIERDHAGTGEAPVTPARRAEPDVRLQPSARIGAGHASGPGRLLRNGIRLCQFIGITAVVFTLWALVGTATLERIHQHHLRRELAHQTGGAPSVVGRAVVAIDINRLGLHQVVAEGVSAHVLRGGPGRVPGSPDLGAGGTLMIAAHRTTMGGPFRRIGGLRVGDDIALSRPGRVVHYHVVAPPKRDQLSDGTPRLLLVTADPPYQAKTTLSVWAAAAGPRSPGGSLPRPIRWAGSGSDAALALGLAAALMGSVAGWIWQPRRRVWLTLIAGAVGLGGVIILSALVLGAASPLL